MVGLILASILFMFSKYKGFINSKPYCFAILVTITTYYIVFAIEHQKLVLMEISFSAAFAICGILLMNKGIRYLGGIIIAHGVFDIIHLFGIQNSGTPEFWPYFCATFDLIFGGLVMFTSKARDTDKNTLKKYNY